MLRGDVGSHASAVFPRSFTRRYPVAARADGVYIYDEDGHRYLDCGSVAAVTIGHGVRPVIDAMRAQAEQLAYVHASQFQTRVTVQLAGRLVRRFNGPAGQARVFFTSGGSEATETAIKIARQYWLTCGEPDRYKILSRRQSYHGATAGALAVSGPSPRRAPYVPLLPEGHHIAPCFCYRCPFEQRYPTCKLACARELDETVRRVGASSVAAFILEPVVGATTGAPPADGYLREIREICDRHGILLIADEVLTGGGRTGRYFAFEHWGIAPDLVLLGKGLSSGYAPMGAVMVAERVWEMMQQAGIALKHGFTYQGHPPSAAAALAVDHYLERHDLIRRADERGEYLARRLETLRAHPHVGDIRGKGLHQSVEFVGRCEDPRAVPPAAPVCQAGVRRADASRCARLSHDRNG